MSKVQREEILSLADYERQRASIRKQVMGVKSRRRIHLGDHLTFLFENADTMRYQVHEMLRAERRSSDADVRHELDTYNELLGEPGQLGATLLIEFDDPAERDEHLREWRALPRHLHLVLADGTRAAAVFDERQGDEERLSSVQYLKFDCGDSSPVALECDLPGLELRTDFTPAQKRALAEDL